MAKNLKLLLTENVDALGIVGDVVNVRVGYARNFLLPRNLATTPSEERIKELASKRAAAERELAELRKQREALIGKLQGVEVKLVRSCNDQGILYGAVTQQDVSTALNEMGYAVKPRDVRITQVIKRVDNYTLHVKLDSDLDAEVKLQVQADRKLDLEKHDEAPAAPAPADAAAAPAEGGAEAPAAEGKAKEHKGKDKAKGDDKHEGERPRKKPRQDDGSKAAPAKEKEPEAAPGTWGKSPRSTAKEASELPREKKFERRSRRREDR